MKNRQHLLCFFIFLAFPLMAQQIEIDFMDLDLETAKDLAYNHSLQLKAASMQVKYAKEGFKRSIREFMPRLKLGYSENDTVVIDAADSHTKKASLNINQPIFDGGRFSFQRQLTKISLKFQQQEYEFQKYSLFDGVYELFINILLLEEQKRLQSGIFEIAKQQLDISTTEYQLGTIREIDYLETQLEVQSLEIQIKDTDITLDELYFQFKNLIGVDTDQAVKLSGEINGEYKGMEFNREAQFFYDLAISRNLEIKKNHVQIEKSREEIRLLKLAFIPQVSLESSIYISGDDFPLQDLGFTLQVNLNFPTSLFPTNTSVNSGLKAKEASRGFSLSSGLFENINGDLTEKQAQMNLGLLREQIKSLKHNLKFEIEKNLRNYAQTIKNLKLKRDFLLLKKKKILIEEKQLNLGEIKRIDLLKSHTQLLEDELSLLQDVSGIVQFERSFEILLGLEPGELAVLLKSKFENQSTNNEEKDKHD